jgi:hypothetical protein
VEVENANGVEYCAIPKAENLSLHKCSDEWTMVGKVKLDLSGKGFFVDNPQTKVSLTSKLEGMTQANESKFTNIVRCLLAHEEYRCGTIFEMNRMSKVLCDHPHLNTTNIMTELMSREDLLEYFSITRGG